MTEEPAADANSDRPLVPPSPPRASVNDCLLTFDCYGTLIDWESGIADAFIHRAGDDGVRLEREDVLRAYAACEAEVEAGEYLPYRDVLALATACAAGRLGWALPRERAGFLAESLRSWRPFPDTNASLERLAATFALGILSNVDDDLLRATRRHLTVSWDLVVTAEQVRSYKPRRGHWVEARRQAAGRYRNWVHVAQSYYHDVGPALELGLPVVWVNRRGEALGAELPRPTREVRDLTEAERVLTEEFSTAGPS